MKNLLSLLTIIAIGSSSFLRAQPVLHTEKKGDAQPDSQSNAPIPTPVKKFNKGSELMGIAVENTKGEKLGGVQDLVLDLPSGRLVYMVLAAGGFLGIGDKLIAIPPNAFSVGTKSNVLVLDADKDALRAAPRFSRLEHATGSEIERASQAYSYFRLEPYGPGAEIREAAGAERPAKESAENGDETRAVQQRQKEEAGPVKFWRASDLIGQAVQTAEFRRMGDVQDVAVDLQSGKLLYAVLATGGFLGIGEKMFAVPPNAFATRDNGAHLVVDCPPDALSKATAFGETDWPDKADVAFAPKPADLPGGVRAPGNRKEIKEPAGVARPAHPNRSAGLTATDQSNQPRDIELTQRMRKAMMADDGLSFTTKNIQIITIEGEMTLRGQARSMQEKRSVLRKAAEIAGSKHVADHILISD